MIESLVNQAYVVLEKLYEDLHQYPELSLQEEKTSARMAEELEEIGLRATRGIGGWGVAALLENGKGPTVLVRADMDALPLTEATGLPCASRVPGLMHACGHDVHMTCLIGTARLLNQIKNQWKGRVLLIAQPAEEKGEGAQAMIQGGLFKKFPPPDYALALHVDSQLPIGTIGYRSGYAFASVDSVDLWVHGRGAHGAYPHLAVDPIVMASEIVLALQTIVSRELTPYESAVVTAGSIHGGTKHNIIPDRVKLELTVRSYGEEVRNQILQAIQRIATQIARAHRAPRDPECQVVESIPCTYNDPGLVERLLPVFKKSFGEANVVEKDPEMGGEDFGLFGQAGIPVCMFRVGSVALEKVAASRKPGARPLPSLHSSEYAPELPPTITTGVRAMVAALLELLGGEG